MAQLVCLDVLQGPELAQLLEAIWSRGDAACVLDPRLRGPARDAQLAALAPTRRIRRDGVEVAEPGGAEVDAGDALVVATSGSTSWPRAVVLTHEAVAASARATSARLEVDATTDKWLCCIPCAHIGGLSVVARALHTSTPLEIHPGFDPDAVADAAARGATLVSLVAAALRRVAEPLAFRRVVLGGAAPPASPPTNAVVTWGMTETGSGVVYDGRPLDGVEVATLDGELYVKGPMLARSYRDGAAIDDAGPDGARGWLRTGDAGEVRDGCVTVHGRLADVINTGGEKVWPSEVEAVVSTHPMVAEVAVWRRDDEQWGQRVVAWVVPAESAPTLDALRALVSERLAPWAAPKELVLVDALPRTPSGKVLRRRLDGSADTA